MLEQYAAVKQQQQQGYESCSSRRLLKGRWVLLLLLSARVPVPAWPRRARVCLELALEQSSDCGGVSLVLRCNRLDNYSCSCARVLLEQYAAVQEQQQQAYTCCSNRVLLECC